MDRLTSTEALVVGLAVGLLLGAVVVPGLDGALADRDADAEPGHTVAMGASCYDGDVNPESGWSHVVANGEDWLVTLNATVVHPPGTTLAADVVSRPSGGYDLALETVEADADSPAADRDCRRATTVRLGTGLPEPSFRVTVDGRTVRSVEQDVTGARLYRLPTPIEIDG